MQKIAIVADTSHDLTYEVAEKLGVSLVSYRIKMDEEVYRDLIDIDSKTFYRTMGKYDKLSTGTPPLNELLDLINDLKDKSYTDCLIITSSHKLTGMHNLCSSAKNMISGINLHHYDTNNVGAGTGLHTILASELRDKGLSVEEILHELEKHKNNTKTYALFRTIEFLIKGGRFNKYKGIIGMFLRIKPLLSVTNGEVEIEKRVRGIKKSRAELINEVRKLVQGAKRYRFIMFSGDNEEEKEIIRNELKEEIKNAELYMETDLTPMLGVHGGPKSIGISVMVLD